MTSSKKNFRAGLACLMAWVVLLPIPLRTSRAEESGLPVARLERTSTVDFAEEIRPILSAKCLACHSASVAEGGVVLESPEAMRSSDASAPLLVEGKPADSLLFLVASHRSEPVMPPAENKVLAQPLTPGELALLQLWILQGARGSSSSPGKAPQWQALSSRWQPIYTVALSRDGQFAACSRANRLHVYHLPSGRFLAELVDPNLKVESPYPGQGAAHLDAVQSLAFSPDGRQLASGGFREVKLWTLKRAIPHEIMLLASPGGRWTVSGDGLVLAAIQPDANSLTLAGVGGGPARIISLGVRAAAFSPDGKRLACVTDDARLVVLDALDGREFSQTNLASPATEITALDGKSLALVLGPRDVQLWRFAGDQIGNGDATMFRALPNLPSDVTAMAGGAGRLVLGFRDGSVRLWKMDGGDEEGISFSHGSAIRRVGICTGEMRAASLGEDLTIRIWEAGKSEPVLVLRGVENHDYAIKYLARSALGAESREQFRKEKLKEIQQQQSDSETKRDEAQKKLQAAESEFAQKEAQFQEVLAKKEAAAAAVKEAEARAQTDPSDESKGRLEKAKEELAAAEKSEKDAREPLNKAKRSRDEVARIVADLEIDIRRFAEEAHSAQNSLEQAVAERKTLAAETRSRQDSVAAAAASISAMTVSPDGKWLAAQTPDAVFVYATETGGLQSVIPIEGGPSNQLAITSTADIFVFMSDGTARQLSAWGQWNLERVLGGPEGPFSDRVTSLAFHPDGHALATGGGEPSRSGEIHLWNPATGALDRAIPDAHSDSVLCLAYSPDGRYLAAGGSDRMVKMFDATSGEALKTFEGHTHHVLGCSWRFDARFLASAGADNAVKIWNVETGEQARSIAVSEKELVAVSFIAASTKLLSASGDGGVRIHNMDNGNHERNLGEARGFIYSSAVDFDGRICVAGGQDGVLRVWDVASGNLVQSFQPPPLPAADVRAQRGP